MFRNSVGMLILPKLQVAFLDIYNLNFWCPNNLVTSLNYKLAELWIIQIRKPKELYLFGQGLTVQIIQDLELFDIIFTVF